jgi:hypothetical protein
MPGTTTNFSFRTTTTPMQQEGTMDTNLTPPLTIETEDTDEGIVISDDQLEKIVRVVHEAWRAWALANGKPEEECLRFEDAPKWQIETARSGIRRVLKNPELDARDAHQEWMNDKLAAGWVHGDVKDAAASPPTHPCLVPYEQLPRWLQLSDTLFTEIVLALAEEHKSCKDPHHQHTAKMMRALAITGRRVAAGDNIVYLEAVSGILADLLSQLPEEIATFIFDGVRRVSEDLRAEAAKKDA